MEKSRNHEAHRMLRPGTHICHFNHEKKICTNIIFDQDNGRSYREMAKLDSEGMVLEYKFKWLGKKK